MLQRFWDKVEKTDSCWNWTAFCNLSGYGLFNFGKRRVLAHRFAYESLKGIIPNKLEIDHLCRNRQCVNPNHLEPVTHIENLRRGEHGGGMKKQTHCKKGHPLKGENLLVNPQGRRRCRKCRKEYDKNRYKNLRRMLGDE